jgi:acyl-CoA thioester hydrolase
MPPADAFQILVKVTPEDIDMMDHVNNVSYLRWVQDVALAHWLHAATAEEQRKWLWFVVRHEIDYKHPAVLGDEIVAKTWVGSTTGVKFHRHTELSRAQDGILLVKALSIWCPIDAQTRRPSLASEEIRRRFSIA